MKPLLYLLLACAIFIVAGFLSLQYLANDPSTEALDQDIALILSQIESAEAQRSAFGDGAIQNIFSVRIEILNTTLAMLEQKRTSLLRRIDLVYTVDGSRHEPDEAMLASLDADKKAAEEERNRFVAEAALYSGGLVKSIAIMNAAASEMAIVQANLAIMSERYGFLVDMSSAREPAQPIAQNTVQDEEAL